MEKFKEQAEELLEYVGGKDNIVSLTHCITRLRFVLKDTDKAQVSKIEALSEVKGTFIQAGQFQVIIGNSVEEFYKIFSSISGIDKVDKSEVKELAKSNMKPLERAISLFSDIFVPILPAIIAGGLILGFRNILGDIAFYSDGSTLIDTHEWLAQLHAFLWIAGEAIFHFLPVGVTWSTVKRFGGSEILGIVMGIMLVSPQLMNAYAFANLQAMGEEIPAWVIGGFRVEQVGYQGQVLPAMFSGIILAKLDIFLNRKIHDSVKLIVVPLLVLLITMVLSFTIIGPISREIGNLIAFTFETLLTGPFKLLGAALFGVIYAPLVVTGLHHTFLTVDLILISNLGFTMIWPMIALSNIAQGSSVLATYFINKDAKSRAVSSPAAISAYLGVTEPAMYGVNIKYRYPFIAAIIGTAIASMFITLFDVRALAIGIGGLPAILSISSESYVPFLIGMLLAIVIPFVLTYILHKSKMNKNN